MTGSPVHKLLSALLPATWRERDAALRAAARLDDQHGSAGLDVLLAAYDRWRRLAELPPEGPQLDLIAVLADLLQGVAHELRRRPRQARELQGREHG